MRQLLSVGIDIGTTTTQLVFSTLTLADVARAGQITRIEITERQVVYQSPVIFTPLLDAETIDAARLRDFVLAEYGAAGVLPAQVETGAAIITGETARKQNADQVLGLAAGLAGDFVVTVAGPNVEGLLAGRGSGAAEYSRRHYAGVTNIDIGGGSANSAGFCQGRPVASAAMNYGGRAIEIDPSGGQVRRINRAGAILLAHTGLNLQPGDRPEPADLVRVCDEMAGLTLELVEGRCSALAERLYLTPPAAGPTGGAVMFSGGVGQCYYEAPSRLPWPQAARFGDLGPLLADRLRACSALQAYPILRPPETLRATVLGAAAQLVTLSGSTIWAEPGILPVRNVPVVCAHLEHIPAAPALVDTVQDALRRRDLHASADVFALALKLDRRLAYGDLARLAEGLGQFAAGLPAHHPLLVVLQRDYARALGQTLRPLTGTRPLLVVDQVDLEEGDYIDIGAPLLDGRVVPLSVKTLIFYHT